MTRLELWIREEYLDLNERQTPRDHDVDRLRDTALKIAVDSAILNGIHVLDTLLSWKIELQNVESDYDSKVEKHIQSLIEGLEMCDPMDSMRSYVYDAESKRLACMSVQDVLDEANSLEESLHGPDEHDWE